MIEHTITLHGPACDAGAPRPRAIAPMLEALEPLLRDTIRQAVFSSTRVTRFSSQALGAAWGVHMPGIEASEDGGTRLLFQLPSLGEAAPKIFAQGDLFDGSLQPEDTGFDLLGATLKDIAERNGESHRYDLQLLRRLEKFAKVLKRGVSRLSIGGHRLAAMTVPTIDASFLKQVQAITAATPPARRVRVQGTLDMLRCSDRVFELILKDGRRLRAAWTGDDAIALAEYLTRPVLIEGDAAFHPGGLVQRLDVEAIRLSRDEDALFSEMPVAQTSGLKRPVNGVGAGSATFSDIAGAWPGEESIEELLQSLDALGR